MPSTRAACAASATATSAAAAAVVPSHLPSNHPLPVAAPMAEMAEAELAALVHGQSAEMLTQLANEYSQGGSGLSRDPAVAARLWSAAAAEGSADSAYSYAMSLCTGAGHEEPDMATAAGLLGGLVEHEGHAQAQFNLGTMFYRGLGVEEDHARAFTLFEAAAAQQVAPAYFNLGNMYAIGEGLPEGEAKSDARAMVWYRDAATRGDPMAHLTLGSWYCSGRGAEGVEVS